MSNTPKDIVFDEEARELLFSGIKQLTDVVAVTLSPKGRNVGVEKGWGAPSITNDGGSIVREVVLANPYENMGAAMAKEVAQKMKETCGDGTTTSMLLLRALVEHGVKLIAAGASPIGIKRGIEKAVEATIKELESHSIPIKSSEEILKIATVSASGNPEIGKFIAEAMEKVGRSGVVTIEEAKKTDTSIDIVEGMQFDRGYASAYFCTNADKMIVEMHNPQILLIDGKVSTPHEILPILEPTASTGRELLIIAEDFEADALSTLVVNRLRGTLKIAAVKSPGFGDRRKAMMEDLAILTGATLVSAEAGVSMKDLSTSLLGSAEKVTVTKDKTTIVNGAGSKERIHARIKQIENEVQNCKSSYEKEKLEERKAKLGGGVAVIRVGAATEVELKKLVQEFNDSLNSTKAAVETGVVTGGGVALLRAGQAISKLNLQGDEEAGAKAVKYACEAPLKQIASNAGRDGAVVLFEVLKQQPQIGYNVSTDKIEDLIKAGVIDPAKVPTHALTFAASVASIVLLSEALITDAQPADSKGG